MLKFSNISHSFRNKAGKFNLDLAFVLAFYDAYLREKSLPVVAECLGIRKTSLDEKIAKHPELRQAMDYADECRNKGVLGEWVTGQLSPDMRKVWDRLVGLTTREEIEAVFKGRNTAIRQKMFCHAILYTGYDYSRACRMVGIDKKQIDKWRSDLEFCQMLEEIQFHKKNFYEKALIGLVGERHPGAILFVNRTTNADRGYKDGVDVTIHGAKLDFDLESLDLDLDTQKKILAAVEKKKAQRGADFDEEIGTLKRLPAPKK